MTPQMAADVLNRHAHRDHVDWEVKTKGSHTFIEINFQVEDYAYTLTPFEAEAIAMRYRAAERLYLADSRAAYKSIL